MSRKPDKCREKRLKLPLRINRQILIELNGLREVGCFSVDCDRNIFYDRSQVKYYVPRQNPVELDLNVGFEETSFRSDTVDESEKMNHILKWIVHEKFKIFHEDRPVDFITHRGTLRKAMLFPYNNRYELTICATKFKGKIYMVAINSDCIVASYYRMTGREKRNTSWGYKFEEYMTSDAPWGEVDVQSTTHEIEEFCIVVFSELADHSLLLKVEIDGMHSDAAEIPNSNDPSRYVELKTMFRYPRNTKLNFTRRWKYLQHWAHAFLAGIEDIVYGLKDEDGIVKEVEVLKTHHLPSLSKDLPHPDELLQSLDSFLTMLKDTVKQDDPNVVYKFDCTSREILYIEMQNPDERYKILPDWYVAEYEENI